MALANINVAVTESNISVDLQNTTVAVSSTTSNIVVGTATTSRFIENVFDAGLQSGNVTLDVDNGTIQNLTLSGNVTGLTLSNFGTGSSITAIFTQSGLGGSYLDTTTYTSNWTNYAFVNDYTDFDTNPNHYSILNIFNDGTTYYSSLITQDAPPIQAGDLLDSNIIINNTTTSTNKTLELGANTTLSSDAITEGSTNQFFSNTALATSSTTHLPEGTNLYYTDGRFDVRFATKTSDDLTEGSTNLYYTASRFNSSFAGKTTTDLTEGANLYYTQSRFDTSFSGKTSDNLNEGSTNLYFTSARANDVIENYNGALGNVSPITFIKVSGASSGSFNNTEFKHQNINLENSTLTINPDGVLDPSRVNTLGTQLIINPSIEGAAQGGLGITIQKAPQDDANANVHVIFNHRGNPQTIEGNLSTGFSLFDWDGPTKIRGPYSQSNAFSLDSLNNPNTYRDWASIEGWNIKAMNFISEQDAVINANLTVAANLTLGQVATDVHTITGNLDVTGNITATGNLNYQNVTDLYVTDQKITLNANASTDATVEIIANRPVAGANTVLRWNEADDKWQYSNDGSTYFNLISNADSQAYIQSNGLTMTSNVVSGSLTIDSTDNGTLKYVRDSELVILESYSYGTQANTNILDYFASGGTAASPAILGNDDRVYHERYTGHDGVALSSAPQAGMHVFYDRDTDTIGANNVPLAFEWYVNPTVGAGGEFEKSVLKITPDRRVVFNNTGTRRFGNNRGLASIEADGNIHTQQGLSANNSIITTAGSISGPTLTDTVLSINSGAITSATTGTFSGQVQAGTLTDGSFSVTGGNFSTVGNIDASGYYQTNGLIKTFGGNIETTTGNIITLANINAGGGTLTGIVTSNSNVETTGFFVGDIDGAVVTDVRNETGATLTKGKAVYLNGSATGDTPHVALADADDSAKMPALGIVYENIANASVGQVVTSGVINVASHGFTQGADLFISTTAGDLSETAPTGESAGIQKIGKVVSANHILVQGAFRQNATPNLNENNIFIGNAANRATTVSLTGLTQNLKTTGNLQVNPDTEADGLKGLTFDATNNRLGLGTATPEHALEIVSDNAGNSANMTMTQYSTSTIGNRLLYQKADGTSANSNHLDSGDHIHQAFYIPWRQAADSTGNASFTTEYGGSFQTFTGVEIDTFADGGELVHSIPVATIQGQSGAADGDLLRFTDGTIRYSDGTVFVLESTTNANLTSLNGQAFYVDQGGGTSNRSYELYYDEARTQPVKVVTTGTTETATDMVAKVIGIPPVGIELQVWRDQLNDNPSSARFSTSAIHKIRQNGDIELACSATDDGGTATVTITEANGSITTSGNITGANITGTYLYGDGTNISGIGGSVNSFENIAVSGQDTVVAESGTDTLNLVAAGAITITTDASTDTITIGGSGGTYGNVDVENFLSANVVTANIETQGNIVTTGAGANIVIGGGHLKTDNFSPFTAGARIVFPTTGVQFNDAKIGGVFYPDSGSATGAILQCDSSASANWVTDLDMAGRIKLQNLTTTEINALGSPEAGDTVFNTTESTICFYNGSAWHKVTSTAL